MKVYVAGPMTGLPEWNFPAFEEATAALRSEGFEVTSPHEIDLEDGFDPSGDGAGFDLRRALERDVEEVLDADGVALLDGWEDSPGAVIEVLTASSKGAPALPVREFLQKFGSAFVLLAVLVAAPITGATLGGGGNEVVRAIRRSAPAASPVVEPLVQAVVTVRDGEAPPPLKD